MTVFLLLVGVILMACILMQRLTAKLPIPALLMFLILGMVFGVDGLFRIPFDNYEITEKICSICLVLIMFYGGFGTSFKAAKPVLLQSALLATLGVVLTCGLTGIFVHFVFRLTWLESLLIGAVIASTDAASVFSILKSQKLNLKDNTASLLEVESGSNDPMSYMLTTVLCTLLGGGSVSIPLMLLQQLAFGVVFGLGMGKLAAYLLGHEKISLGEGRTVWIFAVMLLAYAAPVLLGGNGYLSVYLCGMLLGNAKIPGKRQLIHFYDSFTSISQIMIFFLLGLLVTPKELPQVFLPALLITVFMTFVARPISVAGILAPTGTTKGQVALVSWAGLRGAASIVFAIMAVLSGVKLRYNLFNLVYCVVFLSIIFQGSLLPWLSRKLKMIDNTLDVYKTFNDYEEDNAVSFVKITAAESHPWIGEALSRISLPKEFLVTMILRGQEHIVPNGSTVICEGDTLVLAAQAFNDQDHLAMQEIAVNKNHHWCGKQVKELSLRKGKLIILIQRGRESVIPKGDDVIRAGDTLILVKTDIP